MKNKILIITSVFIVVIIVAFGGAYYYLANKDEAAKTPVTPVKTTACGDLTAETSTSGTVPFAPVVKAAINGTYKASEKICQWTVNGTASHQSYPIKGQCIFGGKTLSAAGTYAISYRIAGQSCSKSITIEAK